MLWFDLLASLLAFREPVPATRSHVYLRVRQKNGHMAWASPIFLSGSGLASRLRSGGAPSSRR